jgi:hypothetical protein
MPSSQFDDGYLEESQTHNRPCAIVLRCNGRHGNTTFLAVFSVVEKNRPWLSPTDLAAQVQEYELDHDRA